MTVSVWVPVMVALIGAIGGYVAQRASKERAKRVSPVDDAAKVTEMARQIAGDIRTDLIRERQEKEALERDYRSELTNLRAEVARLERLIDRLSKEIVKLGGDPYLITHEPNS